VGCSCLSWWDRKKHGRGLTRSASRVSDEGHGKENGAGKCSQHLSG